MVWNVDLRKGGTNDKGNIKEILTDLHILLAPNNLVFDEVQIVGFKNNKILKVVYFAPCYQCQVKKRHRVNTIGTEVRFVT